MFADDAAICLETEKTRRCRNVGLERNQGNDEEVKKRRQGG